jgi:glutamyl/glutaminyl-tRNA synthetase
VPRFAHVPLILGPDKKRLSKRHGATSVMEYARQGYLPEAMVNFLALLGWSPGGSGGNAVFNPEKLDWFGLQHIMRLAPDELAVRLQPVMAAAGLWSDDYLTTRHAWFFNVLELLKPRARRLHDFVELGRFFFADTVEFDAAAVEKHLRAEGTREHLLALDAAFSELETFDPASTEAALRTVADARRVKAASLIHAVRVTVTGKLTSPGLFETLALIGRDRVRARIAAAVQLVSMPRA